jgi:hypothetical protein
MHVLLHSEPPHILRLEHETPRAHSGQWMVGDKS